MLLNYDAFKTIVQENFLSYMPFYFRGMELLRDYEKISVNRILL